MKHFRNPIGLVFLLSLSLVLGPVFSYAYGMNTGEKAHSSCSKDQAQEVEMNCCNSGSCGMESGKRDSENHCSHGVCQCNLSFSTLSIPVPVEVKLGASLAPISISKFKYKQSYLSSGYFSIWQPPKIS